MREMRNEYKVLFGKHVEKRPPVTHICRWDLREIGWKDVDRIHVVQDRD
jgi:hypothetical protein